MSENTALRLGRLAAGVGALSNRLEKYNKYHESSSGRFSSGSGGGSAPFGGNKPNATAKEDFYAVTSGGVEEFRVPAGNNVAVTDEGDGKAIFVTFSGREGTVDAYFLKPMKKKKP